VKHLVHRLLSAAPEVDDVIRRDLLVQSGQTSMLTNMLSMIMLVMVVILLRGSQPGRGLAIWAALALIDAVIFHLGVGWHVRHEPRSPERVRGQQWTMAALYALCGLAWGSLDLLALPNADHAGSRGIASMALVIALAGNVAFASATPGPYLAFHLTLTLSAVAGLMSAGSFSLAAMMTFAMFGGLPLQKELYLQMSGARLLARRNHLLAEELRYERVAVEQANLHLVELNAELAHRATRDPLTGLPNRALFADHLASSLTRARQIGRSLSVIYFDLDRFKLINDTLGHAAGDELLCQVGPRVTAVLRDSDVLARMGGDEFVVLIMSAETNADAERVAERIRSSLEPPFLIGDQELRVTSSLGVAHDDGHSLGGELVAMADAALYRAKEHGRNRVEVFDGSLSRE
jgi:diguanylate cyclase (GGDEF)-like protein